VPGLGFGSTLGAKIEAPRAIDMAIGYDAATQVLLCWKTLYLHPVVAQTPP
jgi:hypothetical protein